MTVAEINAYEAIKRMAEQLDDTNKLLHRQNQLIEEVGKELAKQIRRIADQSTTHRSG